MKGFFTKIFGSSNQRLLNQYSKILGGVNDLRWRVEHAQCINPNDLHHFRENNIIPSVQPTHATSDFMWALTRIGKKRLQNCYQYNTLFKENQLIDSRKYRHITADRIIALDHPWYKKGKVQDEILNIPDWIIFYLRDKFLKFSKKFDCSEKIFIDRSDSNFNHCKLINNQEIIDFLRKKGFESYQTSKLDFFEQIYLFNNAKIIIGPHGAAFSNIIFSKPGLRLIELIPKDHPSIKCEKISNLLKFDYKKIKLNREINDDVNLTGDIKIEISELNKILKSIL